MKIDKNLLDKIKGEFAIGLNLIFTQKALIEKENINIVEIEVLW